SEIKNLQGFVSAAEAEMKRLRVTKGGDALAAAIQVDYEEAVSKLTFNLQKVKLAAELKLREPIKSDKDTLRFAKEFQDLLTDLQRPLPR
ncbi:hypothetical protein, partial [Escherichia coli]|uniref:hypothetical protein n=1 Tax=Escherichia coli TaxID=562 RepID=UPI000E05B7F9